MIINDQLGREVRIDRSVPQRIISLVPSQTELLFDLGLNDEVVGLTKFCIHPREKVFVTTKIGGTKNLDIEKIKSLGPTLIIANKEENEKEQVEELASCFPVWISDVTDFAGALGMIRSVGQLTGRDVEAQVLCKTISENFTQLEQELKDKSSVVSAAYFIWKKPLMVAGGNTFIHDMIQRCGFQNCFGVMDEHYPVITPEQLQEVKPDVILLSSEPFPFREKHINDFKKIFPEAKIFLVDGEMFSWYGSRMVEAPAYFKTIISKRSD